MSARDYTPRPKTITPKKPRKPLDRRREPTGEGTLFRHVYADRVDKKTGKLHSEVSGEEIKIVSPANFAHILPKKLYPLFRLRKDNIVILSWDEHNQYDGGLKSELLEDPRWSKVFEKREQLLKEYRELENKNAA